MNDKDDTNNPYHEHAQATTIIVREKIVEDNVNEPSLEDPLGECFAQFGYDLDLDLLKQAGAFLDSTHKMWTKNGETTEISSPKPSSSIAKPFIINKKEEEGEEDQVEHTEQVECLSTPSLPHDKKVSIEAPSFITIPFETQYEPQASVPQCLKEPSYAKILKDLCKQASKSMDHCPKKVFLSNKVGYLRWRNILSNGYQIIKMKGWKGLDIRVIRESMVIRFVFIFLHLSSEFFFLFHFISCKFIFFF